MVDDGKVFYRFGRNSILFSMSYEVMEEIYQKHPLFHKKFLQFKQKTIIQDKVFPLDYIMKPPRHLSPMQKAFPEKFAKALKLENIFKNVVV